MFYLLATVFYILTDSSEGIVKNALKNGEPVFHITILKFGNSQACVYHIDAQRTSPYHIARNVH